MPELQLLDAPIPPRQGGLSQEGSVPPGPGLGVQPSPPPTDLSNAPFTQPFALCQIYLPAVGLQSADLFACHFGKW